MNFFGVTGKNPLERRLRAELRTGGVRCDDGVYGYKVRINFQMSDDQARKLGRLLSEGHSVISLELRRTLDGLTAMGEYEPLLEFIETHSKLQHIAIFVSADSRAESREDVTSRFFRAVSHSTAIRILSFIGTNRVPTQALSNLLHTTTSLSNFQLDIPDAELVDSQEIEAAFVGNSTVTTLTLCAVHPTFLAGVLQSMKSNPTIVNLWFYNDHFEELAAALPFLNCLRLLQCQNWPNTLNATMMDAFRHNGSLVEVELLYGQVPHDPLLQRYLNRNRGIQGMMAPESIGHVPKNLIPRICVAWGQTSPGKELIFKLLHSNAGELFHDSLGQEDENSDEEENILCSFCSLM